MKRVTRIESNIEDFEFRLPLSGNISGDTGDYKAITEMSEEELNQTAKAFKCSPKLLTELAWTIVGFRDSVHEDLMELFKQQEAK